MIIWQNSKNEVRHCLVKERGRDVIVNGCKLVGFGTREVVIATTVAVRLLYEPELILRGIGLYLRQSLHGNKMAEWWRRWLLLILSDVYLIWNSHLRKHALKYRDNTGKNRSIFLIKRGYLRTMFLKRIAYMENALEAELWALTSLSNGCKL